MAFFDLGEDLELVRKTAARFAQDHLAPGMRERESGRAVPTSLQSEFDGLGLGLLDVPEEAGGLGLGALGRAVVNEELAAQDAGSAVALDRSSLALRAIARFAGVEAAARWAQMLAADPHARAVVAVLPDQRWVAPLSLRLPWVPADRIDLLVLVSRHGGCLVKDGFVLNPVRGGGLRAAGASEVMLNEAPLAEAWEDPQAAREVMGIAHLYAASLMVGALRQSCDVAREYAMEREAFGRPIAQHQALGFLLVDMHMALETARLMVMDAAKRMDSDAAEWGAAAAAFVECNDAARFIAPNAIQILGGSGFMQDYPVEKVMREVKMLSLWMEGVDHARDLSFASLHEGLTA